MNIFRYVLLLVFSQAFSIVSCWQSSCKSVDCLSSESSVWICYLNGIDLPIV